MPSKYCSRCVHPAISATPLTFDEHGVCSGCLVSDQRKTIDWDARWKALQELVDEYRSTDNYDIVIPVSGGKDSYYQTHIAKELGLKPLLVTYHGNNYLPEGDYNLHRMREVFDCDHIIVRPSVDMLVKMNRLGFRVQGDMNWHAHCGIFTVPIQVAVRYKVPLMMWGEHGFMDIGGMYSYNDFVEFTAKFRLEHAQRGYDWYDFTDEGLDKLGVPDEWKEGLTEKDLLWAQYPTDDEIFEVGVRGIYLSNFVNWDANEHVQLVMEKYDWRPAQQSFERTYRRFSNLDDMHENGIHDYLKFVKLGYGRATDHASKDIRGGHMTRAEGIEMVRRYDHVKSRRDLERWLQYVDMTEEEFDYTCDTFRDPRVWRIENGMWVKDNIWGGSSEYGPAHVIPEGEQRALGRKNALGGGPGG